jgi:hypothetical protein
MKIKILFLLLPLSVFSQEISLSHKIKKLSVTLKGTPPLAAEYQQAQKLLQEKSEAEILSLKTDEYLESVAFHEKFQNHVADLFKLQQTNYLDKNYSIENGGFSKEPIYYPAFHLLVRDVLRNNKPWISLLTEKKYTLMLSNNVGNFSPDAAFYKSINEGLFKYDYLDSNYFSDTSPENYNSTFSVLNFNGAKDDLRLAGVLTTPSFLTRYVTTGVNKNRKRAAAIFSIFLCKDMVASIPVPKEGTDPYKKLGLIGFNQATEDQIINHVKSDIHGSDPQCYKCHRQLDPTGAVFNFSSVFPGSTPSPAVLSYVNSEGVFVQKALRGFGDLGPALSSEEDYASCQVRHFWRWTFGENKILTPDVEKRLTKEFIKLEQKPKDFLKKLTSFPEFYNQITYTADQLSAISAFKVLKKCQSCHNENSDDVDLIDIAGVNIYELMADLKYNNRTKLIKRINSQINKNKMPPQEAAKDFSESEIQSVIKWINQGAPNFQGLKETP